ncbi:hypothetical protein ACFOSV_06290 [Algoriphagus namhaensis]|uniref:Uncharacterized protein n=1 Tax=Algoriphagus namhaensis TaxID=915353 RepID=A0ABV8AQA1_9BACT
MKRILLTLKEKWPEYLFEIIVLVIGIYGAFELANYGENKNRRRSEIEILKGCRTELVADLAEINLNLGELNKSRRSLKILIDVLENDGPYHDSLAFHFNYTFLPIHFVHSTSSFETAKSRGLDIISNSEIRSKLIAVYDSQYKFFLKGEEEELAEVQHYLRNILPGRFASGWNYGAKDTFEGEMVPLDFESLKTDQEFLYFIKTQENRTKSFTGYFYGNLKNSVESMIGVLDQEIKRLEQ